MGLQKSEDPIGQIFLRQNSKISPVAFRCEKKISRCSKCFENSRVDRIAINAIEWRLLNTGGDYNTPKVGAYNTHHSFIWAPPVAINAPDYYLSLAEDFNLHGGWL